MSERDNIPLCPVSGWEVGIVSSLRGVIVRFKILTSALQTPEESQTTQTFVLTATQARDLAASLVDKSHLTESGGPEGAGFPKH